MKNQSPLKSGWSYSHSFGVIALNDICELVVTENQYWNGQSWGYSYYWLGEKPANVEDGKQSAKNLNADYSLNNCGEDENKRFFNSDQSQTFLLEIATKFKDSKIRK